MSSAYHNIRYLCTRFIFLHLLIFDIMPRYCSVPGCRKYGGHLFPKDPGLNLKWRVAIKRVGTDRKLWKSKDHDVVCHDHFSNSDYHPAALLGERKRLKADAVPSIFNFRDQPAKDQRSKRLLGRRNSTQTSTVAAVDSTSSDDLQLGSEVDILESVDVSEGMATSSSVSNVITQCSISSNTFSGFSINNFKDNPTAIQYYTGFDDFEHFMLFFNVLGPAVDDLKYKCYILTPLDQLFLTLMKLRQAKDDIELAILFKVSKTTVSRLIQTWINFMYFQLNEIDIWPSSSVVRETMPDSFKEKFPTTRVLLDATEIPIEKPSDVRDQSATYSTYKSRNTLKTMIGCTPRGFVSYISDSYGGSTSDRQIIERSDLCVPGKFCAKDSIMADRGIMVQDLFALHNVFVNTPTMLKGKSQLEPEIVVRDRRVASSRVHVERVIGLAKSYKILQHDLSHSKILIGSRIVYICFMLANFRTCIISN